MARVYGTIVTVLLLLCIVGVLPANAQGVVSVSIDDLQMESFPTTKALVTVRNENGVPISGLGADSFEIVEDGRSSFPPAEVATQVNPDAGVSVVMVIDISGSMKGKPIKEAMRAANGLIDQLSPADRVAIIAFADKVDTDPAKLEEGKELAFTTDKNALRNVVNFLDTKIGWDTPLYDAIYKGVQMVATEPAGKRAVVVMTDGRDERDNAQGVAVKDAGSTFKPDDPMIEANRRNIPIFSIGLVGLGGKIDTQYLSRLAQRTGGVYQQAPTPEELTPLFQNVVGQLKQQYVLSYESRLPQDNNYHSLLVRATLPQGQAFDETKFTFSAEPVAGDIAAAPSVEAGTEEAPAVEPSSGSAATSGQAATPEAGATQPVVEESVIQRVINTLKGNPILAVVIGAGLFLLFILLIALLAVLLRGKGKREEMATGLEYPLPTGPTPGPWTPGPGGGMTPLEQPPTQVDTGEATADWRAPAPAPPAWAGAGPEPGVPPAGGTRVIERAPKRLAMLIDKSQPNLKFDLTTQTTNVGRGQNNQIVLTDPTVSRNHAWIKYEGEEFLVFDVGSANKTYVNDELVTDPRRVEDGDIVRFGDAAFVFKRVF